MTGTRAALAALLTIWPIGMGAMAEVSIPPEYGTAMNAECRANPHTGGAANQVDCMLRLLDAVRRPGAMVDLDSLAPDRRGRVVAGCVREQNESVDALDRCLRAAMNQSPPGPPVGPPVAAPPVVSTAPPSEAQAALPAGPPTFPAIMAEKLDCAASEALAVPAVSVEPPTERRSVSLGVLQTLLEQCQRNGSCGQDVLHLAGLTDVEGVALDPTRDDLVLWGRAPAGGDPAAGIPTADLVVALRSAWGLYDILTSTTRTIVPPLVSIDPDPNTLRQQRMIREHAIESAGKDFDGSGQAWIDACRRPQTVRLEGVPPGSHVAEVMLKADYDLKSIADGAIEMAGWGVESMDHYETRQFREEACGGVALAPSVVRMDRFWFHGGRLIYTGDDKAIELETAEVTLSTEAQMLSHSGALTGQDRPSPGAERFVTGFRDKMRQVGQVLPVYRELINVFRVIALAAAVHDSMGDNARSRLGWLLDRQPLQIAAFPKEVSGRGRFISLSVDLKGGSRHRYSASCGGVEMWYPLERRNRLADGTGALVRTTRDVLSGRPPNALWWRSAS